MNPFDKLRAERDGLKAELDKAQAACAVMREAMEYCGCHEHTESPCDESGSHYKDLCEFCKRVDHALSTDCGTALIARLKELEDEVARLKIFKSQYCSSPGCGYPDGKPCIGCGRVVNPASGWVSPEAHKSQLHARDTALAAARTGLKSIKSGDPHGPSGATAGDTLHQIDAVLLKDGK